MAPSKADNHLLLKGYLPVRVKFPASSSSNTSNTDDNKDDHVTFLYVKEHQHNNKTSSSDEDAPTLFVANAPSFPPIDTPTMLQALLGKFGNIKRVTVVPNPRQPPHGLSSSSAQEDRAGWYFEATVTDRFAHVVFETSKDLKRCTKALRQVMLSSEDTATLTVDAVERQTLADALAQRQQQQQRDDKEDDEEASKSDEEPEEEVSGLAKVLKTYRQNQTRHQQRHVLLEECNTVMQAYEEAEQARLAAISSEPDADGFVTVSHATQPAVGESLQPPGHAQPRTSRARKRKQGGAAELSDFYRFQTKAKRKHDIHDLRQRFQDDLQRIRKIKDSAGGFQPFG